MRTPPPSMSLAPPLLLAAAAAPLRGQQGQPASQPRRPDSTRVPRQRVVMDSARAALLYVSNREEDAPVADYAREIKEKHQTDSIYAARSAGVMDFQKVSYKSSADGLEIPAYLFAPLTKRGTHGHAAMVWVHGGVHGDWGPTMLPFVKEEIGRASCRERV